MSLDISTLYLVATLVAVMLGALLLSFWRRENIAALGWWGFPWGLLLTPIQVGRNLAGAFQAAPASHSPDFERVVREQLARQAMQNAAPPPVAAERR